MKRSFWFTLGVAAGVSASRRVRGTVRRVTPAGIAENVGDAVRELAVAIGSFGADVRAGTMEREAELRATLAARTGIDTRSIDTAPYVTTPYVIDGRGAARP